MNIFKPNAFLTIKYSKDQLLTLLSSSSVTDNILGLRYILCKIQESYDYTSEFDTIIKLIDTTNPVLKKLTNEYLRYYFFHTNDEDRKLLIVNTILKDLKGMENLIVDYLVDFSTPSIIQTYLPHMTKYIENGKLKKSYNLAYKSDKAFNTSLVETLKTDYSNAEYLNLVSLTDIILPNDQLLINLYNTENLKYILRKKYYNQEGQINPSIYNVLLKKDDLTVFYYTFKLIINDCPELLQKAYDTSLVHMSQNSETLYHLLILHENLLDKIEYTNRSYLIYFSDPEYIKKQKIKILFKNLDEISIREIGRYTYPEIVEYSIKKDFAEFEDVFYKNDSEEIIRILYKADICTAKMKYIVQKYLMHIINSTDSMKSDVLRMFVHLCSIYLDEDALPKIQANFNTLLSYFLNLYKRNIISKSEIYTSFKKYTEYKDKIEDINGLIINDISSLLYFNDLIKITEIPEIEIDLYNNLMDCKPYLESKFVNKNINKKPSKHYLCNTHKININKQNNKKCTLSTTEKVFIDHQFIKGVLIIQNRGLLLNIDVLEKDSVIETTVGNKIIKKTLSRESKVELAKVSKGTEKVQLKIYDDIYDIQILWEISPNVVSKDEWEKEFNRLTKYKLVDKFDMTGVHQVDKERFSFKIFDEEVYGRVYNNQIILKGEEEIVKEFK